jgi:hypothetical protein
MFEWAVVLRDQSGRLVHAREDARFRGVVVMCRSTGLVAGTVTLAASVKLMTREDLFGEGLADGPEHRLVARFIEQLDSLGGIEVP